MVVFTPIFFAVYSGNSQKACAGDLDSERGGESHERARAGWRIGTKIYSSNVEDNFISKN